METMFMLIILSGLIVFFEIAHLKERRDLLDRLMARDLPELTTYQKERKAAVEVIEDRGVAL